MESPEATQVPPVLRVMSQRCQVSKAPTLRKLCQIVLSDEMVRCYTNAHRQCSGFNPISFVDIFRDYNCCAPLKEWKEEVKGCWSGSALSLTWCRCGCGGRAGECGCSPLSAPAVTDPYLSRERQLCPAVPSVKEQDTPGTATGAVERAPPTPSLGQRARVVFAGYCQMVRRY